MLLTPHRFVTLSLILAGFAFASPVWGQTPSRLDSRPCGPDSMTGPLRFLIPQGFGRADFKPACRTHDNCYGTPGSLQGSCDNRFRSDLLSACDCSRAPILCRMTARVMAAGVSRFGSGAHQAAQTKAGFQ